MLRRDNYWLANQFAIGSNTSQPYDMIKPSGAIAEDRWAAFIAAKLNELAAMIRFGTPAKFAAELDAAVTREGRHE